MAFDQTNADIATLNTLVDGVVAACQSATADAKSASDALAAGDTNISGQLQEIITKLQPYAPAPAAPAADPNAPTS